MKPTKDKPKKSYSKYDAHTYGPELLRYSAIGNPHRSTYMNGPNIYREYTIIQEDRGTVTKMSYRNVGDKNLEGSVQINIEKYNKQTNRTVYTSLSVPFEMVDMFLHTLKIVK